jgi:hypothetical protein
MAIIKMLQNVSQMDLCVSPNTYKHKLVHAIYWRHNAIIVTGIQADEM